MENAVDSLYMGFAVLAFVIALSVSIFAFSNVTNASQRIIDMRDKTSMYKYIEPEGTERKVKVEDIVPTLYRAYYENYMIKFDFSKNNSYNDKFLYSVKNQNGGWENTNTIDLEGQKIGNHQDANKLIDALLQGNLKDLFKESPTSFSNFNYDETLHLNGLYGILKENTFKESIGLYYMEDRVTDPGQAPKQVEDVNKNKKRIITYTLETTP